ncbi:MAG: glycosyltransferase [Pseudomonadota bacterium]
MVSISQPPRATLIISIYRDTEALDVILHALRQQSTNAFNIIISEDGESTEVAQFIAKQGNEIPLIHLTQADRGFRKNRALNRAIVTATNNYLIFIDGDCVPHRNFVQAHLHCAEPGVVNCGRRIELGERTSTKLRKTPSLIENFYGNLNYLLQINTLRLDQTKNIELGFYLPMLQRLLHERDSSIVGCNFSIYRQDLLSINGFDEAYHSPGIGEDSDLELRLRNNKIRIKNNKFTAIQYHLYHPRSYTVSNENSQLLATAKASFSTYCKQGINGHSE